MTRIVVYHNFKSALYCCSFFENMSKQSPELHKSHETITKLTSSRWWRCAGLRCSRCPRALCTTGGGYATVRRRCWGRGSCAWMTSTVQQSWRETVCDAPMTHCIRDHIGEKFLPGQTSQTRKTNITLIELDTDTLEYGNRQPIGDLEWWGSKRKKIGGRRNLLQPGI